MDDDLPSPQHTAPLAAAFEGGIALLAVGLGWLVGRPPLDTFRWSWADAAWGVVAILPPLGLFFLCVHLPWRPFARIVRILEETLLPLFAHVRLVELLVIAMLAGLGEEMLFRGVIQGGASAWLGRHTLGPEAAQVLALLIAGALFGLVHAITLTYVFLAALIGVYLGWTWLASGNLLVPIIAHAGYDLIALLYLLKIRR